MSFTSGYFSAKPLLKLEDYNNLSKLESTDFFSYLRTKGFTINNNIEQIYINEHQKIKNDLIKFADKSYSKFFYAHFDSLNIKQIYKSIRLNKQYIFHPLGNIKENAIYNSLKHHDYTLLEEEDKFIFEEINKRELSFKEMSDLIDNLLIIKMNNLANSIILKRYLETKVTLDNILIIQRSLKLNISISLINGGLFELNDVKEIIKDEIVFKNYLSKLFVGHLENVNLNNLNELSKYFKSVLFNVIKALTYEEEGIVVSYIYKKFLELENIKALYNNKDLSEMVIL